MKYILKLLSTAVAFNMCLSGQAMAAATPAAISTPTVSLFNTVFGLTVVLAVIAALAWFANRMTGRQGNYQSVARIVGGVSVGARERVVVVEVGNRWLVVGVAAGQVNAIANLGKEEGAMLSGLASNIELKAAKQAAQLQPLSSLLQNGQSFASWFKQSLDKTFDKKHEL